MTRSTITERIRKAEKRLITEPISQRSVGTLMWNGTRERIRIGEEIAWTFTTLGLDHRISRGVSGH